MNYIVLSFFFFFQAEDGIRDLTVTGVQTCALPISDPEEPQRQESYLRQVVTRAPANIAARLELVDLLLARGAADDAAAQLERSEEHTSELQSQSNLVCRLLLEKKKTTTMLMERTQRRQARL